MSCISPICNCKSKYVFRKHKLFHARQNSRVVSSVDFLIMYKKKISMILNSNFHVLKPSSNHLQASVGMAKFRFFFEKPSIF